MEEQKRDEKNIISISSSTVGIFKLNERVSNYVHLDHIYYPKDSNKKDDVDFYDFVNERIILWTEETGIFINTIKCIDSCVYKGYELIKMDYTRFLAIYNIKPDHEDYIYSAGPKKKGRNYHVFELDDLGMMLWVWRGKIRQVLIYKLED